MIPWDIGSSSGSCNANEFREIHRVSKIIRERMHSPLESVWAGDVQNLYVNCVPTAYVQTMRPGTCPLHRNSCDGKPQGGSQELRHRAAVGFAKWPGIKCFICYDAAVRGAWPCVARPRDLRLTALLLVACSHGLHLVPCGPCSGRCPIGLVCIELASCSPPLLPARLLAAGPSSEAHASSALQVSAALSVAAVRIATLLPAPSWSPAPFYHPCSLRRAR